MESSSCGGKHTLTGFYACPPWSMYCPLCRIPLLFLAVELQRTRIVVLWLLLCFPTQPDKLREFLRRAGRSGICRTKTAARTPANQYHTNFTFGT